MIERVLNHWRLRTIAVLRFLFNEPPVSPCFAIAAQHSVLDDRNITLSVDGLLEKFRILLGVPKFRTPTPKKQTRKFSYNKLLTLKTNLISCQNCGEFHEAHTICGACYEKVREVTNAIKRKMMQYNPYIGERQNRPFHVRFMDDADADKAIVNGKRIIELDRPRPSWFKPIFKKSVIDEKTNK